MTEKAALPKRQFELIDSTGIVVARSVCGLTLAIVARDMFPDQQQDPDRSGKGWDIQPRKQVPLRFQRAGQSTEMNKEN